MKIQASICCILLICTSCAVRVKTIQDHHVDFSEYSTFCWLKGCAFTFTGPSYLNDSLLQVRLQNALISEMAAKGIHYNNDAPDLLMDVHVVMESDTVSVFHLSNDRDIYVLRFVDEDIVMLKGTLVIDLIDRKTGRMVWRSVGVSYFNAHPELTDKNFQRGIARVLKHFDPEKQKP